MTARVRVAKHSKVLTDHEAELVGAFTINGRTFATLRFLIEDIVPEPVDVDFPAEQFEALNDEATEMLAKAEPRPAPYVKGTHI